LAPKRTLRSRSWTAGGTSLGFTCIGALTERLRPLPRNKETHTTSTY